MDGELLISLFQCCFGMVAALHRVHDRLQPRKSVNGAAHVASAACSVRLMNIKPRVLMWEFVRCWTDPLIPNHRGCWNGLRLLLGWTCMKVPAMPRMQCALGMVLAYTPCQPSPKMGFVLWRRFWQCPNGKECKYRHALPPGYVLKSQMKVRPRIVSSCVQVTTPDFLNLKQAVLMWATADLLPAGALAHHSSH